MTLILIVAILSALVGVVIGASIVIYRTSWTKCIFRTQSGSTYELTKAKDGRFHVQKVVDDNQHLVDGPEVVGDRIWVGPWDGTLRLWVSQGDVNLLRTSAIDQVLFG